MIVFRNAPFLSIFKNTQGYKVGWARVVCEYRVVFYTYGGEGGEGGVNAMF